MFSQIGNNIFQNLLSPESLSISGETTYAEHALINGKPRLQAGGNELHELTISLKLRAEFCNPTQVIKNLRSAKDKFEVLPLITGSGNYLGEFVIVSIAETYNQCLADGTLIEAGLQLVLKEIAVADKLQQQQQSAKQNGFAVNKKPVNTGRSNKPTCNHTVSKHISAIKSNAAFINNNMGDYVQAPSAEIENKYIISFRVSTRNIRSELQLLHDFEGVCIQSTNYKALSEAAYNTAGHFAAALANPSLSGPIVGSNNDMQASLRALYNELQKNISNAITRQA